MGVEHVLPETPPAMSQTREAFIALARRGVSPLVIYSAEDTGLHYVRHYLRDVISALGIRIEIIPATDHIFSQRYAQVDLEQLLTQHPSQL
jgi:hypothetical protein